MPQYPPQPSGVFAIPETGQMAGPFTDYLVNQKPQPAPQPTGWGGKPALVMTIADQFLRGVQRGRVASFMREENERQKNWDAVNRNFRAMMSDPRLSADGRQQLYNEWLQATGHAISTVDEGSGGGKSKGKGDKGGNPLVNVFKEIGIGMTGGKMPKGSEKIDPDAIIGRMAKIYNDPQYNVDTGLQQDQAKAEALIAQAKQSGNPVWQQDMLGALRPIAQSMDRRRAGAGSEFLQSVLPQFDVRPAPGSNQAMMLDLMTHPAPTTQTPPDPVMPGRFDEMGRRVTPAGVAGGPAMSPAEMQTAPRRFDQFGRPVVPEASVMPQGPPVTPVGPTLSDDVLAARRSKLVALGMVDAPKDISYTDSQGKTHRVAGRLVNDPMWQYWVGPDNKPIRSVDVSIVNPSQGAIQHIPNVIDPTTKKPAVLLLHPDGHREYLDEGKMASLSSPMKTLFEAFKAIDPKMSDEKAMSKAGEEILKKGQGLDEQTAQFMARIMLTQGPNAVNLGMGNPIIRKQLYSTMEKEAKTLGLKPEDLVYNGAAYAANKTALTNLTRMNSFIDMYSNFVEAQGKRWKTASDNLKRSDIRAFNTPINSLRQGWDDPTGQVAAYLFLVNQIQTEFTRLVNNPASVASPPQRAQAEMDKIVDGSATPSQVDAILRVMHAEVGDKRRAAKQAIEDIRDSIRGGREEEEKPVTADSYTPPSESGKKSPEVRANPPLPSSTPPPGAVPPDPFAAGAAHADPFAGAR